jgi:hypothetical protein
MEFEVFLDPLANLGVVQEAALYQFVNVEVLLNSVLAESVVQDFVVLHEFVIKLRLPLHGAHVEGAWVNLIDDLAVNSSSSALLDFGQAQLQLGVEEIEEHRLGHLVALVVDTKRFSLNSGHNLI